MLSFIFSNSPPGSTIWISVSTPYVHGTGSGKLVYNKRHPLSAKAFVVIDDDSRKLKVECFGPLDVVLRCNDDVRVTLENIAVVKLHPEEAQHPHKSLRHQDP